MKLNIQNRSTKFGTVSALLSLLLLVALIAVNLLVSCIPKEFTILDSTHNQFYTLSETTEDYIKSIDESVTLYFLCDEGTEDATLRTFLDRYAGLNGHISVKVIDPVENPTFSAQYTDAALNNYSVIVESGKRSIYLDYYDFYLWENEQLGILTAEEYQTVLSSPSYAYYLSYYETIEHFNGESKLTNAITYVTSDSIPKIYALSGHGETALGTDFCNMLKANAYDIVTDFSLFSEGGIPSDCAVLLLNAPTKDLSAEESAWIGEYLENGGRIFLTTAAGKTYADTEIISTDESENETTETLSSEFPRLLSLLEKYGLSATNGVIIEMDSSRYYSDYPVMLLPSKNTEHAVVSEVSNSAMMFYLAHGILLDENASDVTLSSLFTTSDSAYTASTDSENLYEKDDGSLSGPFHLGATAESGETRIVWFSSAYTLEESIDARVSGGNSAYALSAFRWLSDKESGVSIPSLSLEEPMLLVSGDRVTVFAAFFCAVIPLSILIGGIVFLMSRRRA